MRRFLSIQATPKFLNETTGYMATTYARPELVLVKGEGAKLWDADGKEYIDFTAGIAVTALGHSNKKVTEIISEQAQSLLHSSNLYHNQWAPTLSRNMIETTRKQGGMQDASRLFLANSGSEANEAALKFARKVGLKKSQDKYEVVAFKQGFHGRTFGSLSATCNPKYQAPFAPMVPGFHYGELNDFGASLDLITDKTCGVIIEPIQGEGGVNEATGKWLEALRAKCTAMGAVLIYDEIQCGLGRTGKLWAHQHFSTAAHPDIVTMAKALGNGYPIGATMISEQVNDQLNVGDHGTTYGGNPMAARIGDYVLSQVASPEIQANVEARHKQIVESAQKWLKRGLITEIRGKGLLLGLQLADSPDKVISAAKDNGLLVITCGKNTIRLVPALNIASEDTSSGLDILEAALEESKS